MFLETIRSKGLAHLSYVVGSRGECAVIDPRRDCRVYLDIAKEREMAIRYILETHRNEDYVIGSLELAEHCDAMIVHGPGLDFAYGSTAREGEEFPLGNLTIEVLHTPGHTDESLSYVLRDPSLEHQPLLVFSGDVLFVGEVGRTDLCGKDQERRMAANLYDSIFGKILPLGDEVLLLPAHGAGSVCGKAISTREISTLAIERRHNPALRHGREVFIRRKMGERMHMPRYFKMMERYNLEGPPLLRRLPSPPPLSRSEFQELLDEGVIVVDTRSPTGFAGGHVRGAVSIWIEGIPSFAGCVLSYGDPILLVTETREQVERAVRYLIRIGFDSVAGYLRGGIDRWIESALPIDSIGLITAHDLDKRMREDRLVILDVRTEEEFEEGHIKGALNIYCGRLQGEIGRVPRDRPVVVVCSVGYRGTLGASLLRRSGWEDIHILLGGMSAWGSAGFDIVSS